VRQHAAGALVHDFEATQDARDGALGTSGVDRVHPVDGERRLGITLQDALLEPLPEQVGGHLVAVGATARHVDPGDVVPTSAAELDDVVVGEHIVGRGDDLVPVDVRGVANGVERFESWHGHYASGPMRRVGPGGRRSSEK